MTLSTDKQRKVLSQDATLPSFNTHLKTHTAFPLLADTIEIFQMNVGKLCNMTCSHCHVEAGPHRTELMDKATFDRCLDLIKGSSVSTVDLTGGAPEMNPHLADFIEAVSILGKRVIVRSNLTVLKVPKYAPFIDIFAKNKVEVVASLPCYTEALTDKQRGDSTFKRSIEVLQTLNKKGYGQDGSSLVLNLVHNPVSAKLAPDQAALEADYKTRLYDDFGIRFNQLFCINNLPISRYLEYLIDTDQYDSYMQVLLDAFNPAALSNVMCRNTISISWDGYLFDCDFNQMLDLPLAQSMPQHVDDFDFEVLNGRPIITMNHCYGCTAGAGSSCQGALDA